MEKLDEMREHRARGPHPPQVDSGGVHALGRPGSLGTLVMVTGVPLELCEGIKRLVAEAVTGSMWLEVASDSVGRDTKPYGEILRAGACLEITSLMISSQNVSRKQ